jgi:protein-S-isoprenylcysteine O-methyltransferase Ste14
MYTLGSHSFIFIGCWVAWLLYWIFSWQWSKQGQVREAWWQGLLYKLLLIFAFVITVSDTQNVPGLRISIFHANLVVVWIGIVLTVTGLVWTIWARRTLADNWSSKTEFKQDHELIQSGPYALTRHPIYTGLLAMFAGTTIAAGTAATAVGFVCALLAFIIRAKIEENLLSKHFAGYQNYKQKTWTLIPFIF